MAAVLALHTSPTTFSSPAGTPPYAERALGTWPGSGLEGGTVMGNYPASGTGTFRVVYRANHPALDPNLARYAPESVEIHLPESHLQALLFFVASRIMNPVGMTQEFHAGNSYYAKYEAECRALEAENYQIDTIGQTSKFRDRGFV